MAELPTSTNYGLQERAMRVHELAHSWKGFIAKESNGPFWAAPVGVFANSGSGGITIMGDRPNRSARLLEASQGKS